MITDKILLVIFIVGVLFTAILAICLGAFISIIVRLPWRFNIALIDAVIAPVVAIIACAILTYFYPNTWSDTGFWFSTAMASVVVHHLIRIRQKMQPINDSSVNNKTKI